MVEEQATNNNPSSTLPFAYARGIASDDRVKNKELKYKILYIIMQTLQGRKRAYIKNVKPEIDCGLYPIKRVPGEMVHVEADIFADGHEEIRAVLMHRKKGGKQWQKHAMRFLVNDHWEGGFIVDKEGWHEYTIQAWVDPYLTWLHKTQKKFDANQDIQVEIKIGENILTEAIKAARGKNKTKLNDYLWSIQNAPNITTAMSTAQEEALTELVSQYVQKDIVTIYDKVLEIKVERKKALFSAWYELFPRSTAPEEGQHGTFRDVIKVLPNIASMGFDVLYLPPIHPIGKSFRKGKDNAPRAKPGEPGSPWAIGSEEGGHKSIHPALGTMDDFKALIEEADQQGLEIAIDLAYQCAPDHPYVKEHPQWFKWRPDGTVQYAENPPKKYQDVLPINFDTPDWQNLWTELKSIVDFWIDKGVKIFRVDNPHTKPFVFWEWMIGEINKSHPEIIFLAEAFTKPRVMEHLAKIGFTQSYTYFTWRNSRNEFIEYLNELTKTQVREYYRPNFWPNTPDILPVSLQHQGEPAFIARYIMAATLSSNCGIYGPVFEYNYNVPHPDREEFIDNEKYEIKKWDWDKKTKTKEIITLVNIFRNNNPALQTTWNIHFADTDNPALLCYGKTDDFKEHKVFVAVNMDSYFQQGGWIKVPVNEMGLDPNKPYIVKDILTGKEFEWHHERNFVLLDPNEMPAHVFEVTQ
jgi:starch synthase (maltosyl-transferring)